jgi:hypothetical protein
MKTILSSRRIHYLKRLSIFLIMIALMFGTVGANCIQPGGGGGGVTRYNLTISGTTGGTVTYPISTLSTPPLTEWTKLTRGPFPTSVIQTLDRGYAVAGYIKTPVTGSFDFYLGKTDAGGNQLWFKTYGYDKDDGAMSVVQTSDGGYALAGYTYSFEENQDIWLVKTDADGNKEWDRMYNWAGCSANALSVVETSDYGYALAGYLFHWDDQSIQFLLVKIDWQGNLLWYKQYGGAVNDIAYSLVRTSDGGYALAGYSYTLGTAGDFWLVKTDVDGNKQWDQRYGGLKDDGAYSLVQTVEGGYVLAGYSYSFGTVGDFWLVKTDAAGNMQWSQTYGGTDYDVAYSLVQTLEGGYALAGAGGSKILLVKTDTAGNELWSTTYGSSREDTFAYSLVQTVDGGYALAGCTNNDMWLVKTGPDPGLIDSDGDGLLDDWETNGIDYNSDGIIDLTLTGANPNHKDLYLEIDYMGSNGVHDHQPDVNAVNDVINAFANAPVNNPDGVTGITLHIDVDESIPHQDVINVWDDFNNLKNGYFGTPAQRTASNTVNILAAKRMAYRYCLFIHNYAFNSLTPTTASGIAELPGNDFIVSLGSFTNNRGNRDEQAGTLMHELGHTLGLRHGGGDNINGKPNYLSIMSYARQFSNVIKNRPLDYSRAKLPSLDEISLNESLGIQGPPNDMTVYGPARWNSATNKLYCFSASSQGPIDWNFDGDVIDSGLAISINDFTVAGFGDNVAGLLDGYDDWANLRYSFRGTPDFADGSHLYVEDQEITLEIVEAMQNITIVNGQASQPYCFIATAAYGSPMAKELGILREFRDEYLMTNPVGRALVDVYYRVSPPIAEFITEHPILKPIVRAGLLPAVAISTAVINFSPA